MTLALNPNFVGAEPVCDVEFDAWCTLALSASDALPGPAVARHHRLQGLRCTA